MAESSEKTFEPTQERLRKARQRGEVSQSRDLTSAMSLAAGMIVLASQAPDLMAGLEQTLRACFTISVTQELSPGVLMTVMARVVLTALQSLLPPLLAMAVVGLFVSFVQVGSVLSFDPFMPKLPRLNPLAGMKKLLLSGGTYIELLKSTLKVIIVGWLCWVVISGSFDIIVRIGNVPPRMMASITGGLLWSCIIRVALCYIGIAALDVFYQRWKYLKDMKMSRKEVEDEQKEQEGDPHHKAERKRLHEEIASHNMLQDVRKASVIVTNPTHIACALRYDPGQETAPRLLGKGQGYLAEKIREIAKEEDIPIVRDVSLAHTLYEMELDTEIPEELYEAVSELLRWVEIVAKSEGKTPIWRQPRPEPENAD